ncbi:MAG: hypothetical protein ACK5W1_04815 [Flavobacteriales bacterium]
MNPWHLAQALVDASPLKPEVIRMMEDAGVDGFYIDLVRGSQGGGYTEKMIFESEITTFTTEQQVAINNYMRSYLEGADGTQAADALDMLAMVNTDIQLPMEINLLRRESDFAGAGILLGNCNLPTEGWCSVKSHLLDAESNELSYCDMDPLKSLRTILKIQELPRPELRWKPSPLNYCLKKKSPIRWECPGPSLPPTPRGRRTTWPSTPILPTDWHMPLYPYRKTWKEQR